MTAQTFEYGPACAYECALVSVKLESPVGSQLKGVEFESQLRGVKVLCEMTRLLRLNDSTSEGGKPLLHNFSDAVAHWTRSAVKLRGDGGKKAAAPKNSGLHIAQPGVTELPKTLDARLNFESRANYFAYEDSARGLDGRHLQILLGSEVSEEPTLTQREFRGEPPDSQPFQPFGRGQMDRGPEDSLARAFPFGLGPCFRRKRLLSGSQRKPHSSREKGELYIARTFVS